MRIPMQGHNTKMTVRSLKCLLLFLCVFVAGGEEISFSSEEKFVLKYIQAASQLSHEDLSNYASEAGFNAVIDIGEHAEFENPCFINYTQGRPTSVHELQPADIEVVAAIGDSITAGSGIDSIFIIGSFTQTRGSSWSIGGEGSIDTAWKLPPPVVTVPNIIEHFKQKLEGDGETPLSLTGFAQGTGSIDSDQAGLNQAVIGATAEDMYGQAERVIERMQAMSVSFNDSWKLMTILVGGNDMCDFCDDEDRYSAANYKAHLKRTLDLLKDNVPRMYVNIVPMFSITPVKDITRGKVCDLFHSYICSCVMDDNYKPALNQLARDYHTAIRELVDTGDYELEDFAVVIQDFLVDFTPIVDPDTGEYDLDIFSPDCFHPNRKGHEMLAYMLWNTMVRYPVGMKPRQYPIYSELDDGPFIRGNNYFYACPTEEYPYLWTNSNSNVSKSDFNFTTTAGPTTTTIAATTTEQEQESDDNETVWIVVGCVVGAVGICVLAAITCLIFKERKDDEESLFA